MKKRIVLLALMFTAIFSMAGVANAAILASDYIAIAKSYITANSDGSLTINFSITGCDKMDMLGVKTIILQERADSNQKWEEAKTYSYADYANMIAYGTSDYKSKVTYDDAKSGYQYRAKVYFYAEKGGYDTRELITLVVKAK